MELYYSVYKLNFILKMKCFPCVFAIVVVIMLSTLSTAGSKNKCTGCDRSEDKGPGCKCSENKGSGCKCSEKKCTGCDCSQDKRSGCNCSEKKCTGCDCSDNKDSGCDRTENKCTSCDRKENKCTSCDRSENKDSVCDFLKNKVPLYRLFHNKNGDHFYTTSLEEANNAANALGYTREGTTGWVLGSSFNEAYIPIYRLYRAGSQNSDHFYTANEAEARNAAQNLQYTREGVAFYCAIKQEGCENYGSKVPLHRYNRGTDHFYTTSLNEGSINVIPFGGTYEGILCYIWTS